MDIGAARERIKAALDSVPDTPGFAVKGYVRRPAVVQRGDAWPLWRGAARPEDAGFTFMQTFDVVMVVGQEDPDSFVDERGEALVDALESGAYFVESMAPAVVPTSAGDLNALMITGRCE